MSEEKENTFDMKQLLEAFNDDQKATVKMVNKSLEEERMKKLQQGLQKKGT